MKVTMFHFMPYRDLPEDFPRGLGFGLDRCPMVGIRRRQQGHRLLQLVDRRADAGGETRF